MAAPETPSPLSFRPIGELRALERNARKHPESQLLQLMRLIEEYGFTAPIVADERSILAGHGRLTAATRLYAASKRLSMPDGSGIPDGCKMDSYRTLRVDALWQAAWQIEHGKKA
jgi:hypothetical protein